MLMLIQQNVFFNMDNADLSNVTLYFLPPNTTSHLEPCDAGIIKSIKSQYRRQLLNKVAHELDEYKEFKLPDAKKALEFLVRDTYSPYYFINRKIKTGLTFVASPGVRVKQV